MDCSAFRRHHVAFVDDTLPGDLLVAAVRHAAECPACAKHDTAVRRSLLLARNICGREPLECSSDFAARLEARLRATPDEQLSVDGTAPRWWEAATAQVGGHLAGRRTRQGLAAAVLLAAVSAGAALRDGEPAPQIEGLGSGTFAAAPFGSPFAAVPSGSLAEMTVEEGADATPSAGGLATELGVGPDGVTLVTYDETLDPATLVAPASVGVPVWAAAVLAGEVPAALWREVGVSAARVRVGH